MMRPISPDHQDPVSGACHLAPSRCHLEAAEGNGSTDLTNVPVALSLVPTDQLSGNEHRRIGIFRRNVISFVTQQGASGEMQTYRIVYLSRAVRRFHDTEITELASHAASRNAETGVTGLLLYDGGRFIQALEGDKDSVISTMDRIEADQRHSSISYLYDGPAADRQFGLWSMEYRRTPDDCCTSDFIEKVKFWLAAVEDFHIQAAFIGFAVLGSHRPRGYVCRNSSLAP